MQYIQISGNPAAGRTTALQALADCFGGRVIQYTSFVAAIPALSKGLARLDANVFIDDVPAGGLAVPEVRKLLSSYSEEHRIYYVEHNE